MKGSETGVPEAREWAIKTYGPNTDSWPAPLEFAEAYAASRLSAVESDKLQYMGKLWYAAARRAEAAESEIQRLRERIAELETVKNAAIELDVAITEEFGADHEFQDDRWAKAQKALRAELEGSK